jgi:hypothetical protein
MAHVILCVEGIDTDPELALRIGVDAFHAEYNMGASLSDTFVSRCLSLCQIGGPLSAGTAKRFYRNSL